MRSLFLDVIGPGQYFVREYGWTIPVALVIIVAVVVVAIILRRRKK